MGFVARGTVALSELFLDDFAVGFVAMGIVVLCEPLRFSIVLPLV